MNGAGDIAHLEPMFHRENDLRNSFSRSFADDCRAQNQSVRVGSSRVDLQACKLEYSIVSPK